MASMIQKHKGSPVNLIIITGMVKENSIIFKPENHIMAILKWDKNTGWEHGNWEILGSKVLGKMD